MNRLCLIPLLLLAACSKEGDPAPAATDPAGPVTDAASALPSDAAETAAPKASAATVSRYTSFKSCTLVEEGDGEDWSVSRCEGMGGFDLQIDYGDARDDLVLLRGGRKPAKLGLIALGTGGFNTLADTAEWRGTEGPAGFKPARLIVRNNVSEDPVNAEKVTSILMVIDLEQACVIAQVRPKAGQNEAARSIADGPPRPCLMKATP